MLNQKNKKTVEKKENCNCLYERRRKNQLKETSNCWNEQKVELMKETSNCWNKERDNY